MSMPEFGSTIKEMQISDKDGAKTCVRLVQVKNTPPISLWDDTNTPLQTQWGLSHYNAETKKKGDLDLILTPELEARMRLVDAFVVEAGKDITRPHFKKTKGLLYRPLVSHNDEGVPIVKVKVGANTTIYTPEGDVTSLEDLTRNAKCLTIAQYTTLWFTDTQYGVTLGAKAIMVKPADQTDMSLDAFPTSIPWD